MEARFQAFCESIHKIRVGGNILKWSEEIKQEAIFLMQYYSVRKIAQASTIHEVTLYCWKKGDSNPKSEANKKNFLSIKNIHVTQIQGNQKKSKIKEEGKNQVHGVIKAHFFELEVHSKYFLNKILDRLVSK